MFRYFVGALLALGLPGRAAADTGGFRAIDPPLPVAPFALQERNDTTFRSEELRGKVWIAHFFFTSCPGPCVKTLPAMQRLQQVFAGRPDIALVSVTVNSAFDTPQLLREYAAAKGADPKQWFFLTGPEEQVHEIIRTSFFKAVQKGSDPANITHSPELLLIDRDGNLRGYVDGQDPAAVDALILRTRTLAAQKYWLPAGNAVLNGVCALLLVLGYVAIRRRRETLHIACMIAALVTSAVFLTSYLYFHFAVQLGQPTRFRGEGWMRATYFAILLSHTVLAVVVTPLALYVAYQGWRDQRPRHVRVARWTLPLWLYVSVTGVVVYVLLYVLYPPY